MLSLDDLPRALADVKAIREAISLV
jgi:hypothetical protein